MSRVKRPLLVVLLVVCGFVAGTPRPAYATNVGECNPFSPGHYWIIQNVVSSSGCTGGQTCIIGHQICEWDCVTNDPYDSGNTHPENIVCHQPTWCGSPICPTCCPS
jgi:hypothetical protein